MIRNTCVCSELVDWIYLIAEIWIEFIWIFPSSLFCYFVFAYLCDTRFHFCYQCSYVKDIAKRVLFISVAKLHDVKSKWETHAVKARKKRKSHRKREDKQRCNMRMLSRRGWYMICNLLFSLLFHSFRFSHFFVRHFAELLNWFHFCLSRSTQSHSVVFNSSNWVDCEKGKFQFYSIYCFILCANKIKNIWNKI